MRYLVVLLALAAACVVFSSAPLASAGRRNAPTAPSWNAADRWLQNCNDEESAPPNGTSTQPNAPLCATDPLQCTWGDEDDVADSAYGKISAGVTTSDTLCLVTDTCSDFACPHFIDVYAQGNGLQLALTSDRGDSYTIPYVSAVRQYQLCFRDPHFTGDTNPLDYPLLGPPFVDGSYGILTYWTLTVTATKTTTLNAGLELAQNNADGHFGYYHTFSNVPCVWG